MSKRIVRAEDGKTSLEWHYESGNDHITLYFEDENEGGLRVGIQSQTAIVRISIAQPLQAMELHPDEDDATIRTALERVMRTAFNRLEVDLGMSSLLGGREASGVLAAITLVEAASLVVDSEQLRGMVAGIVGALASKGLDTASDKVERLKLQALEEMAKVLFSGKRGDQKFSKMLENLVDPDDPDTGKRLKFVKKKEDELEGKKPPFDWKKGW